MIQIVKRWWRGKFIPPTLDEVRKDIRIPQHGRYERPWPATFIGVIRAFYLQHWQWVWGMIVAIIGLYLAVLALK